MPRLVPSRRWASWISSSDLDRGGNGAVRPRALWHPPRPPRRGGKPPPRRPPAAVASGEGAADELDRVLIHAQALGPVVAPGFADRAGDQLVFRELPVGKAAERDWVHP